MLPKVTFKRSWLYDGVIERPQRLKKGPGDAVLNKKLKSYEKAWQKEGDAILRELQKVTKLKWHEKDITCYVTWGVRPFSDPLTINVRYTPSKTVDTITHELIHRIVAQKENPGQLRRNWRAHWQHYAKRGYPKTTVTHIAIHAIHEHVLRALYSERRLAREKQSMQREEYALAWDVVEKEGYKNIIAMLTKGL